MLERPAAYASFWISFDELVAARSALFPIHLRRENTITHRPQELHALRTAPLSTLLGRADRILRDQIPQMISRFAVEWPFAKHDLPSAHAETPVVDRPGVASSQEHLRRHVGHGTSDGVMGTGGRIMYRYVEVGDVGMASSVQQDIIGFNVSVDYMLLM